MEKVNVAHVYDAEVLRVVDGDTLDVMVDLGFQVFKKVRVRLYGVDTPEVYGVKEGSDEYLAGKEASQFVHGWLADLGDRVVLHSHDGKQMGTGKYGRWLAHVYPKSGSGPSLNEELVLAGHAERVSY